MRSLAQLKASLATCEESAEKASSEMTKQEYETAADVMRDEIIMKECIVGVRNRLS